MNPLARRNLAAHVEAVGFPLSAGLIRGELEVTIGGELVDEPEAMLKVAESRPVVVRERVPA
jgi:hypothetical protein